MRRTVAYSLIATILGVLLTLLPILVSAQFEIDRPAEALGLRFFSEQLKSLEETASKSEMCEDGTMGVEVLAFSFIIACLAYLSVKHKSKYKYYRWIKPY